MVGCALLDVLRMSKVAREGAVFFCFSAPKAQTLKR
jgi:hypothetical protein